MDKNKKTAATIDEYIETFPEEIRTKLHEIKKAVQEAAPQAQEKISYKMPAFFQNGILVYFAGFKDHISLFPTASGIAAFQKELTKYKCSKGTIQFPLDEKLPIGLIKKIVKFKVKENREKKERVAKSKY